MGHTKYNREEAVQLFRKHKVIRKIKLLDTLDCSTMTLWRLLSQAGYLSSYNFNASYYTLKDIPRFDENGLWMYHDVRFSRYGSLTDTIVQLVFTSDAGMSAHDLHALVGVPVLPLLTQLSGQKRIFREKRDTSFVYFHVEEQKRDRQRRNRQQKSRQELERVILPDPIRIIAVLVELIKKPEQTVSQIVQRLRRQGYILTEQEVTQIFFYYQLPTKKNLIF